MPRWPERTAEERFWEKVDKTDTCWLWTAGIFQQTGYGQFGVSKGNVVTAHKFSYELLVGPVPEGMQLDHIRCVRTCVRPEHLRLVTSKQNKENRQVLNRNNTSGVRGVSWNSREGKWRASVTHNSKLYSAGYFDRIEDAEAAAIAKRIELFTHNEADRKG